MLGNRCTKKQHSPLYGGGVQKQKGIEAPAPAHQVFVYHWLFYVKYCSWHEQLSQNTQLRSMFTNRLPNYSLLINSLNNRSMFLWRQYKPNHNLYLWFISEPTIFKWMQFILTCKSVWIFSWTRKPVITVSLVVFHRLVPRYILTIVARLCSQWFTARAICRVFTSFTLMCPR